MPGISIDKIVLLAIPDICLRSPTSASDIPRSRLAKSSAEFLEIFALMKIGTKSSRFLNLRFRYSL
jgi:hypothetical protein